MKIGIDARPLTEQLTGIGRYCLEVIKQLQSLGLNITLYSPIPIMIPNELRQAVSVREHCIRSKLAHTIWSHTILPCWTMKDKIDILWGPAHRIPALLPKRIAKVVTIHDLVWKRCPETMHTKTLQNERIFTTQAIKSADIIIADSNSTANDVKHFYPNNKTDIRVVHLAANTNKVQQDLLSTLSITKPYILFIGTKEPRKNLDRLITAFSQLERPLKEKYQLIICGKTGWGDINLEEVVKQHQLENSVQILDYPTDEELTYLYQHAYCVAMPSIYEGFGLPILEAHAHGVPVITSNLSSMPEVAGEGALLVDPFSVTDMTKKLSRIMIDSELRDHLAIKATENIKQFSWEKTATEILSTFKDAVKLKTKHSLHHETS